MAKLTMWLQISQNIMLLVCNIINAPSGECILVVVGDIRRTAAMTVTKALSLIV
jgi:hypothetical protein